MHIIAESCTPAKIRLKYLEITDKRAIFADKRERTMIRILDIEQYSVRLKATIQKSGRLGFTADTAEALALSTDMSVQFARDDEGDRALYMVLREGQPANSFRVMKAGQYFYLPTRQMFDAFGEDYINKVVMFDLTPIDSLDAQFGGRVYKMARRELDRNNKKESEEDMEK